MRSIFLIVCMCCSLITLAQSNFKVSGIVIGVDKEPIIGATIQDKSNQTGVITDVEGRFTINASSRNAVLRVGYIGMKSEEIKVEGRSQITIILQEEAVKIDEVVVTALGIKHMYKMWPDAIYRQHGEHGKYYHLCPKRQSEQGGDKRTHRTNTKTGDVEIA